VGESLEGGGRVGDVWRDFCGTCISFGGDECAAGAESEESERGKCEW
jgi:hypothetical protein